MQSLLNDVIILILISFNKKHLDKGVHALSLLLSAKEKILIINGEAYIILPEGRRRLPVASIILVLKR